MIEGGRRTRGASSSKGTGDPLVSVVTVVRNGAAGLEATIRAVLGQTYRNLEYIIVDGASTDGTLDIIRRFDDGIDYWISERDTGLYDAMNKGVRLVTDPGAYVMFANSDDTLAAPDAIQRLVEAGNGADFIYGMQVLSDGEAAAIVGREVTHAGLARHNICHAAALTRRRVFDEVGMFDLRYRLAADYDFFVRCFALPVKAVFVEQVVANVRMFGLSENNFMPLLRERLDILRRRYSGASRLAAVARIYCQDIPRHFARLQLRRFGLLSYWRAIKAM